MLTPFIQPIGGESVLAHKVKIVKVPFVLGGKHHHILDNLEAIFPNVAFPPELEEIRQAHVGPLGMRRRRLGGVGVSGMLLGRARRILLI